MNVGPSQSVVPSTDKHQNLPSLKVTTIIKHHSANTIIDNCCRGKRHAQVKYKFHVLCDPSSVNNFHISSFLQLFVYRLIFTARSRQATHRTGSNDV
jgi:hypothetical protein